MKIALFHNTRMSGAKRLIYEHVRYLHEQGHTITLYAPASARDAEAFSLAPFCQNVHIYGEEPATPVVASGGGEGEGRVRRLFRRIFGETAHDLIRDLIWTRRQEQNTAAQGRLYEQVGQDIARGDYDLFFAYPCAVFYAPAPLFQAIKASGGPPVVFYCNESLRHVYEWSMLMPPDYDTRTARFGQIRRRGRIATQIFFAWEDRERDRYIAGVRAADHVFCNSWFGREDILRTTGIAPRVCHPGVDAAFFCPDATNQREPEVLSVGALRPEKRHELVLDAVALITKPRRPRLRVLGYAWSPGGAFQRALETRARERGVELIVETEVTEERLREAYRRCTTVAFAPLLEPFGLVTLEAMACETPVVGVAEGGLRETIHPEENSLLTDSDPVEFAAALDRVLVDATLRERLGAQGRQDVCAHWTWKRSGERLEALLQESLSKRDKRGNR